MIFDFLRRRARRAGAAYEIPAGQRIYAIGDVHGAYWRLVELQEMIRADLAAHPVDDALMVYLGDYIDRGEHSREVVDLLLAPPDDLPAAIMLRGNHEQTLLDCLEAPERLAEWRSFGGLETLISYGVNPGPLRDRTDRADAMSRLHAKLPEAHLRFFLELPTHARFGGYFFCHAGVRPGVPLERQSPRDLLWIREEFLASNADFGARVVHGHTPAQAPELMGNRINIDTGACMTGVLTCVALEGRHARFLQT
jgi:serine/threonine protein phosphatase 1